MSLRPLPPHTPATEAQLFDRLSDMFGFGDHDESTGLPWWKFRSIEISKIRRCRASAEMSIADLWMSAMFCKAHQKDIRAINWLPRHVPEAWVWWQAKSAAQNLQPVDKYAAAIRIEMANEDQTWFNRLIRAAPAYRESTYQDWLRK